MSTATFTNKEKFTFRVFSSMYIDWGLEITGPDGEELYYCPSSLSNESYGHKPNPKRDFVDWDEAEQEAIAGDETAFVPWDEKDWKESLESEADDFLDAYTVTCKACEKVTNPQTSNRVDDNFFCTGCSPQ
tara:strand:- start:45 stop:437 length:393 start_codon:yes stop_codon:yes gene_type:complete